jgi:hypothetical protein
MKFESHDSILNIILHIIKLPISSSSKQKNQFKLPRLYTKLKIENFMGIFFYVFVFLPHCATNKKSTPIGHNIFKKVIHACK